MKIRTIDLNKSTKNEFNDNLDKGDSIVLVHADWCPHCHDFLPHWNNALDQFRGMDVGNVSMLGTVEEKNLGNSEMCQNVRGYPTVMSFKGGKRKRDYKGPMNLKGITKFIRSVFNLALKGGKLPCGCPDKPPHGDGPGPDFKGEAKLQSKQRGGKRKKYSKRKIKMTKRKRRTRRKSRRKRKTKRRRRRTRKRRRRRGGDEIDDLKRSATSGVQAQIVSRPLSNSERAPGKRMIPPRKAPQKLNRMRNKFMKSMRANLKKAQVPKTPKGLKDIRWTKKQNEDHFRDAVLNRRIGNGGKRTRKRRRKN